LEIIFPAHLAPTFFFFLGVNSNQFKKERKTDFLQVRTFWAHPAQVSSFFVRGEGSFEELICIT